MEYRRLLFIVRRETSGLRCNESQYRRHEAESVAVDVDNFNLGVVFEVFAQFGNVYVHAAAIEIGITAPDLF